MFRKIILINLFGFLCWLGSSSAQVSDLHFDFITMTNGLSSVGISDIMQDRKGYIWFASDNGLNRYDGYSFKVYRNIPGDSTSLQNNFTIRLAEDKDHCIWISTTPDGLSCFNPVTQSFTNYKHDNKIAGSLPSNLISSIFVDSANTIWIGFNFNGFARFDRKTKTFKVYSPLPDINQSYPKEIHKTFNSVYDIQEGESGTLWLSTHNGLYSFDKETEKIIPHRACPVGPGKWRDDLFSAKIFDKNNGMWIASWSGGLSYYNYKTNTWKNYKFDLKHQQSGTTNIIRDLAWKNENEIWVCTSSIGIGILNIKDEKYFFFDEKTRLKNNLPEVISNAVFVDRSGNTWFANDNGVLLLRASSGLFTFQELPVSFSKNGKNFDVGVFYKDLKNHQLYIATNYADGLNVLDEKTGVLNHYLFPFKKDDGEYCMVSDLLNDSKNSLWVSTRDFIMLFDKEKKQFIPMPQPEQDSSTRRLPYFYKMVEGDDGCIWITSLRNGIYKYDPAQKKYFHYRHSDNDSTSLCSNKMITAVKDNYNRLWFGSTNNGISLFDAEKNSFINYSHSESDSTSLVNNIVQSITKDAAGNLWIATFKGITEIKIADSKPGKFYNYTLKDGLPFEFVYHIKACKDGNIWFASSSGITRWNPAAKQIQTFTSRNGLHDGYGQYSLSEADDGEIFFGGFAGYFRFYPSALKYNSESPHIVINAFKIFDKDVPYQSLMKKQNRIELGWQQNFFSFEFASINFSDPEKMQYAYKLEGFDKDWIYCGSRRYASYTNLDGGNYNFKAKAANSDGIWSNEEFSIPIHIERQLWKKPWFISLLSVCCAAIIYFIYMARVKGIRATENLKTTFNKQIAETEMKALRAQMNPHFIFNCLNSINRYIVKSDAATASLYLTKFSKLIRLILENSNSKHVQLDHELAALQLYLEMEALRFDHKFDFEINIDKNVFAEDVFVPPLLIQPYVENAIWHGLLHKEEKGVLKISVNLPNEHLEVIIEDNGVGRAAAAAFKSKTAGLNKSLGMQLTRERLAMLNNNNGMKSEVFIIDLKDANGKPEGTKVQLNIPL